MISVPIRNRRAERGQFVQKLQHAIPSVIVLADGLDHLSHDPSGAALALGVAEVVTGVLVIGSVARGLRKMFKGVDQHAHHGVDWIDICIALMLGVEAYAKYHATHHVPRPTIVLAIAMLILGLAHGQIAAWGDRRRRLTVSADGIVVPKKPLSRVTLPWADVATIDVGDRYATISAVNGRRYRFDLSALLQADAVRDALLGAKTFLRAPAAPEAPDAPAAPEAPV